MTSSTLFTRVASGLLVVSLGLFGAACGDDDDEDAAGSQNTTATTASSATAPQLTTLGANSLSFQNFAFIGIDDTRAAASTWRIVNQDTAPHTITAVDGSFVWRVEGGQTGTFTHTLAPGSYPIKCDVHPSRMTGTLIVR